MKNVLLVLVITAALATAHHGYAAFDTKSEVTFSGTVSDFHWTNPHCIVDLDVKNDQGQVRTWHGEMTSPAHLAPRGWTAATLESGDKVTVTGYIGKNNVPSIWITKIVLPDGKELKVEAEK